MGKLPINENGRIDFAALENGKPAQQVRKSAPSASPRIRSNARRVNNTAVNSTIDSKSFDYSLLINLAILLIPSIVFYLVGMPLSMAIVIGFILGSVVVFLRHVDVKSMISSRKAEVSENSKVITDSLLVAFYESMWLNLGAAAVFHSFVVLIVPVILLIFGVPSEIAGPAGIVLGLLLAYSLWQMMHDTVKEDEIALPSFFNKFVGVVIHGGIRWTPFGSLKNSRSGKNIRLDIKDVSAESKPSEPAKGKPSEILGITVTKNGSSIILTPYHWNFFFNTEESIKELLERAISGDEYDYLTQRDYLRVKNNSKEFEKQMLDPVSPDLASLARSLGVKLSDYNIGPISLEAEFTKEYNKIAITRLIAQQNNILTKNAKKEIAALAQMFIGKGMSDKSKAVEQATMLYQNMNPNISATGINIMGGQPGDFTIGSAVAGALGKS